MAYDERHLSPRPRHVITKLCKVEWRSGDPLRDGRFKISDDFFRVRQITAITPKMKCELNGVLWQFYWPTYRTTVALSCDLLGSLL